MSKTRNTLTSGICGWGMGTLLLLVLLGLALPQSADARPVEDSSDSNPPIIGISIGNSQSSVGAKINNTIHIIPDKYGNLAIPSVVSFKEAGEAVVGQDALDILLSHPEQSVTGFKRLLGKTYEQGGGFFDEAHYKIIFKTNGTPAIEIPLASGSVEFYPMKILALVIHELKTMAEKFLGEKIKEAVVTIPASFDSDQRADFKETSSTTALDLVHVMNEPTAASMAYNLDQDYKQEKYVLVYNLDGTTFDATVVYIEDGVHEIYGTARSENVSSSSKHVSSSQLARLHSDLQGASFQEENNTVLGFSASRKDQVPLLNTDAGRDEIIPAEEFIDSFNVEQALQVVDRALREENLTIYDITDIVPSGDSARIPKLRSRLLEHFPHKLPVHENIDPRLITTYGAARQGSHLYNDHPTICCIRDATLWQLGVETAGGIMSTVVKRGTPIPTKKSNIFTTTTDNQTSIAVTVFKGQRDFVANNTKLGSLELDELIRAPRGVPEFEVTVQVDYNHGLSSLKVSLTERGSNKTASLFVEDAQLQPYTEAETELFEANIGEWEQYAEEERILRDALQKRIVEGEDGILETTTEIIERAVLHGELLVQGEGSEYSRDSHRCPQYPDGCPWWGLLGTKAYAGLEKLFAIVRW